MAWKAQKQQKNQKLVGVFQECLSNLKNFSLFWCLGKSTWSRSSFVATSTKAENHPRCSRKFLPSRGCNRWIFNNWKIFWHFIDFLFIVWSFWPGLDDLHWIGVRIVLWNSAWIALPRDSSRCQSSASDDFYIHANVFYLHEFESELFLFTFWHSLSFFV